MVEHQSNEEAREPDEPRASARAESHTPSGSTSEHPAENDQPAPDIERFFCIYCGYDLTGHSGHERRCPECGKKTTLDDLRMTLAMKKGISAWETPVLPSLLFLPTAFFGLPSAIIFLESSVDWFLAMFWLLFAISAVAWGLALRIYFRRYCNHHDWLVFLGESQLFAVQIGFGGLILGVMVLALIRFGFDSMVLIVAMASAAVVASSFWPYRDMKRRLQAYKLPKPPETNANE